MMRPGTGTIRRDGSARWALMTEAVISRCTRRSAPLFPQKPPSAQARVPHHGSRPSGSGGLPRVARDCGSHHMILGPLRVRAMGTSDRVAKFRLGQVVKHRMFPFRGVIFDVDPEFSNTEEWYQAIPEEIRPAKNQPFYHLLAENEDAYYVAYVS